MAGEVATTEPELAGDFGTLMEWADEHRRMRVRTNAETERDCSMARQFGAEGIGLCRTEHMFFDAELLMAHALGIDRQALLLDSSRYEVPESFVQLVARRMGNEPIAYIVGYRDFWTIRVEVGPGMLIPRPDSETLIEVVIDIARERGAGWPRPGMPGGRWSGCLAAHRDRAWGAAIDRAPSDRRVGSRPCGRSAPRPPYRLPS